MFVKVCVFKSMYVLKYVCLKVCVCKSMGMSMHMHVCIVNYIWAWISVFTFTEFFLDNYHYFNPKIEIL